MPNNSSTTKTILFSCYLIMFIMLIVPLNSLHINSNHEEQLINKQQQHLSTSNNHNNNNSSGQQIKNMVNQAVTLYHNDQQIQQIINNLTKHNPSIIKKVTIPYLLVTQYSCQNDHSYNFVVIDNKKDDGQRSNKQKKEVVITCNVHARELLTAQVCVEFINKIINEENQRYDGQQYLLKKGGNDKSDNNDNNNNQNSNTNNTNNNNPKPQFQPQSKPQPTNSTTQPTPSLLQQSRLTIFYRSNNQRDKVINKKDYCIRKDQNNIDINRNFVTNFNYFHADQQDEEYPGPQPLTEPFSKCLDHFLSKMNQSQQSKIHTFIDIHTGEFTLYDSFQSQGNDTRGILQTIKEKYCPQCRIASLGSQKDDQVTNGQIFTDVKQRYKAKHSILLQIYGGFNNNLNQQQNCVAIFNPLTVQQLNYYKHLWANVLEEFVLMATKDDKE